MQLTEESGNVQVEYANGTISLNIYKPYRGVLEKVVFQDDEIDNIIYCLQRIQDISKNMKEE